MPSHSQNGYSPAQETQAHIATHVPDPVNPTLVSSTASNQHKHEQELLSNFTVPEPPISTKESTLAAGTDVEKEDSRSPDRPRTLWMGDLDPWLDEAAIVNLWWQILGQEVSVKLIRPRAMRQTQNEHGNTAHSGYCFVEFRSFEAAQQALGLNGQLLPDIALPSQQEFRDDPDNQKKYFRLNWASGATLTAPIVESPEYSLFVGDLSASTTEAHLLSFFQKSFPNSIRTVRVMTDPISGKSRCFGFVRFSDERERQRALVEMNGVWFGGRPLRVANATPRSGPSYRQREMRPNYPMAYGSGSVEMGELMYSPNTPQGYYPSLNINGMGNMGSMGSMGNMNMGSMGPNVPGEMVPYAPSMSSPHFVDPANTTVFVGGLSSDVNEQTLYTLFKPFGAIIQIKLPPGKNCGFVKYSTREEAEEAILNMEGFVIGGHRVRLGWGRISATNKKYQRHQMAQMQMQAMMGYDPSSVYGAGYPIGQTGAGNAQVYAPMAMQMRPPGMYHYMGNPEMPDYEQGTVSELGPQHSVANPIVRSRSLDHGIEGGLNIHAGENYVHQLAQNFDTLSLDAASQYQPPTHVQHGFNPYSVYPPASGEPKSASSADSKEKDPESSQLPESETATEVSSVVKDDQKEKAKKLPSPGHNEDDSEKEKQKAKDSGSN